MKTPDNNQLDEIIFAKYLSGEMTDVELRDFENIIAVSGGNKINIEKMKKQWSAMKGYQEQETPDTSKAWNKLHARLDSEKLIPLNVTENKFRLTPVLVRVAAVILILVGVGVVLFTRINRKPPVEMVHVNTGAEANTLVKTLNDGSVIYIAQNSQFSFPKEFENDSRNVALKGEAFFDIARNPEKPFIIETDEAFIQVLGTAFNVKTQNGHDFELAVDRGKVKVTLKKDPSHPEYVVAGEKVTTVKNSIIKFRNITSRENAWYRQHMQFKDESMQNIIRVLNRNFNTTFAVEDKEIAIHPITVTFNKESAETMTELLCATLNLKSQNINGSVVLSKNKENAKRN